MGVRDAMFYRYIHAVALPSFEYLLCPEVTRRLTEKDFQLSLSISEWEEQRRRIGAMERQMEFNSFLKATQRITFDALSLSLSRLT